MSHVGGDAGEPLRLVIITGVSGAGKTEALRCFEDMGYFCIDNLPPALLPEVAQLRARSGGRLRRVAVVIDIRGGVFFEDALQSVAALEAAGVPCHILFLEAQEETLVRRYKETRRRHPLAPEGRVTDG
ncbi:MAG: RNase adaptor protein RapZ, partial [Bacillota bacterium]